MSRLAHHVFFTLEDPNESKIGSLISACQKYLADHDGVVDFSVGRRDPELNRPVNAHYHVSLHVIFRDRQAHDVYQSAAKHLEFIALEKPNWQQVQVFDSLLED